ncbi:MAG: alanine/glycine:cation symporter family protein [Bacteroidota bacterium]
MWGTPLVVLLMGGGVFFFFYSRFTQFIHFGHAINVLRGKYDDPTEKGEINHYQALSTHLAATVGMGNISGVALAILAGGPGAIFWMWVSALFGMATKFFTNTLAIMYRGKDSLGELQGGPMYVIREGLSRSWYWLAILFSVAGMVGVLPIFQANQLTQVIHDVVLVPLNIGDTYFETAWFNFRISDLVTGIVLTVIVTVVVYGGVKRIGIVAGNLVPIMVVIYFITVITIIGLHIDKVIPMLSLIITDAFTGEAVAGGVVGSVILIGAQRAAFSNEAGIGTAPMAHGAAKTDEPVREGLVAMIGPAIDTLVVCTLTALAILITDTWVDTSGEGVSVTIEAFNNGIPYGGYILAIAAFIFALTSLFSLSYYGEKCYSFLFGAKHKKQYIMIYIATIIIGSIASLKAIVSLIDGMYATMAIPTMISALLLSPKVVKEMKSYFKRMKDLDVRH